MYVAYGWVGVGSFSFFLGVVMKKHRDLSWLWLLMLAKSIRAKANSLNEKEGVCLQIQFCGFSENVKDLFKITDSVGRVYASEGNIEDVKNSLLGHPGCQPLGVSH